MAHSINQAHATQLETETKDDNVWCDSEKVMINPSNPSKCNSKGGQEWGVRGRAGEGEGVEGFRHFQLHAYDQKSACIP